MLERERGRLDGLCGLGKEGAVRTRTGGGHGGLAGGGGAVGAGGGESGGKDVSRGGDEAGALWGMRDVGCGWRW